MENKKIKRISLITVILLSVITCLFHTSAPSIAALDMNPYNYFDIDYNTDLSKTDVNAGEVFSLSIEGTATCTKNLPVGIDQADLTLRISAYDENSNTEITLTDDFVISIEQFPERKGTSSQFVQSIDMVFPHDSNDGKYEIVGQLVSARIDGWDITEFIPSELVTFHFGILTYNGSAPTSPVGIIMSISPREVNPGEAVTIKVQIRNNTSTESRYILEMTINEVLHDYREITLSPLEEKAVTFIVNRYEEGDYVVSLDGYSDKFSVVIPPLNSSSFLTENGLVVLLLLYVIIFIL